MLRQLLSNKIVKNLTLRNYSKFAIPIKDMEDIEDDLLYLLPCYKNKDKDKRIKELLNKENDKDIKKDKKNVDENEYNDRED